MTKKERNEIIKFAEKLTDEELEDALSVIQWDGYTLDIKERIEKLKRQNFKERNK